MIDDTQKEWVIRSLSEWLKEEGMVFAKDNESFHYNRNQDCSVQITGELSSDSFLFSVSADGEAGKQQCLSYDTNTLNDLKDCFSRAVTSVFVESLEKRQKA